MSGNSSRFQFVRCGLLGFIAIAGASAAGAQQPPNEQPASASVTVTNSKTHGGVFGISGVARVCGVLPAELNFAGVPAFNVTFYPEPIPARGTGEITDVSFDSKQLVGGVTVSTAFFLSVTLQSTVIGSPFALVLDTSRPGNTGSAKLVRGAQGTLELTIEGRNIEGEDVRLTLLCGAGVKAKPAN